MIGPLIRSCLAADVPDLALLEQQLFGVDAWTEAQLQEELSGPGRRAWVVSGQLNERLVSSVGYAITRTVGDIADLQRIGVHSEQQRNGVARALLETALSQAKDDGADRMLLEVSATNAAALGFYAAAGFVEIDRRPRYYKDGSDAIVLRKSLAAGCNWSSA